MTKVSHIQGRRWFQKGNTYHSVAISYADGSEDYIPFEYGYDFQYLVTALKHLEKKGYAIDAQRPWTSTDNLGCTYDVLDVARKRDL